MRAAAWAFDYVALSAMIIPAALALAAMGRSWRRRQEKRFSRLDQETVFLLVFSVTTCGFMAVVTGGAGEVNMSSMYGRYLDVVVMLIVGYSAAYAFDGATAPQPEPPPSRRSRRSRRVSSTATALEESPGRWWFYLAAAAVLAVIVVVTLPGIDVIFTGNLGVYASAWVGSKLALMFDMGVGRGSELIAVAYIMVLVLCGAVGLLWKRVRRVAGAALMVLLVANTALAYTAIFDFRAGFEGFRHFARESAQALEGHFSQNPHLPRLVYIDSPPDPATGLGRDPNLATEFAVCNLELYRPDVCFRALLVDVQVPAGTPLFSMRPRPFPLLCQEGDLRLYACANSRRPAGGQEVREPVDRP